MGTVLETAHYCLLTMVHQAEGCVFDLLRVSLYSHKCTVVRPRFAGGDPDDRTAEAGQWLDSS